MCPDEAVLRARGVPCELRLCGEIGITPGDFGLPLGLFASTGIFIPGGLCLALEGFCFDNGSERMGDFVLGGVALRLASKPNSFGILLPGEYALFEGDCRLFGE